MIGLITGFMIHPCALERWQQLLLLLPLCLCVSVVYKTTKVKTVREIPLAALVSWATIVIGMCAVGVALLLLYELAA